MADNIPIGTAPVHALRHTTIQRFIEFRKLAPESVNEHKIIEHIIAADTALLGIPLTNHPEISGVLLLTAPTDAPTHETARLSLVAANFMMAKSASALLRAQLRALNVQKVSIDADEARETIALCERSIDKNKSLLDALEKSNFKDDARFSELMDQWPSLLEHIKTVHTRYPILARLLAAVDRRRTEYMIILLFAAILVSAVFVMLMFTS